MVVQVRIHQTGMQRCRLGPITQASTAEDEGQRRSSKV